MKQENGFEHFHHKNILDTYDVVCSRTKAVTMDNIG